MTATIPFVDIKAQYQRIEKDVRARLDKVLGHGKFIMGPEVGELEAALSDYCGVKHTISVSSGTDALQAALMAAGIGRGDVVFLPAFTFTATAEVVLNVGAQPAFVDVDKDTFNIDVADLKQRILDVEAQSLRPRAVMAVDLFGLAADYEEIAAVADAHGMLVIADAAQSFGAERYGRKVGTLAPLTCTSFFPAKPLGCYGDGGAVFTDDDDLADVLRSIRAHGKGGDKYDIVRVGMNGRLDTMQAAVLLAKLPIFEDELAARETLARYYDANLPDSVVLPRRPNDARYAWAQYTIKVADRDGVAARLSEQGVPTAVYYPRPLHLQTAFQEFGAGAGSIPNSEALSGEVLSLPMHPYMPEETAARICAAVSAAVG